MAEWGHLYDGWTAEVAEAELAAMDRAGRIPTTWVAFAGPGRDGAAVLGSVSLINDDELAGFDDLRPWLASLYVVPAARGRGLGRRLVDVVVRHARDLGVERLHLYTAGQERLLRGARLAHGLPADRARRRGGGDVLGHEPPDPAAGARLPLAGQPRHRHRLQLPAPRGHARRPRPARPHRSGGGLHLAGEAASSAYPGTMHGAWFSGEAAAAHVVAELPDGGDVVVVGAGLAGLAAARALGATGRHRAVVLEAGSAPGGRTMADDSLGGPVHLGAAWVHGEIGNPVAEQAARLGIDLDVQPVRADRDLRRRSRPARPRRGGASAPAAPAGGRGPRPGRRRGTGRRTPTRSERPSGRPSERRWRGERPSGGDRIVLAGWLRGEYENLYAAPIDDLSLAHRAEPFHLPGDDLMLAGSLNRVVEALARTGSTCAAGTG